jgi:transcriptional regulator with XRE-family HTH domain
MEQRRRNHSQELRLALGQLLRKLRLESGLSQEDLALAANLDRTYISQLERGLKNPTVQTLLRIATVLRVRASQIVAELEELQPIP